MNINLGHPALIGNSPCMRALRHSLATLADKQCTVLIEGETGTGKDVAVRYLHSLGSPGPFLAVNCGCINENLATSEFFGHSKGSFTGASDAKRGLFDA